MPIPPAINIDGESGSCTINLPLGPKASIVCPIFRLFKLCLNVQCSVALRLGADSRLLLVPDAKPSIRFYFTGFLKECINLYQKPDLFTGESLDRVGYMRLDTQIVVIGPWRLTGGRQLCLLELEVPSSRYRVIPSSRKI
jgi:hypothetical protein